MAVSEQAFAALEARLNHLEDLEAIKALKARYCEICDDDHNPEDIVTLFTDDGIWEGKGIGHASGHAEIRALFERFQKHMSFSQHMVMNPLIEVDGNSARARWCFFGPFTFRTKDGGEQAMWQSTRYHEDYEKVAGVWKIKHLRIRGRGISATFEDGWAARTNKKA